MLTQRYASSLARVAAAWGALAFAAAAPAAAEPMFKLGQELPMMLVRVCPTLEDAKEEAAIARRLGGGAYVQGAYGKLRNNNCDSAYIVIVPLGIENAIQSFRGWTIAYAPLSQDKVSAGDHSTKIGVRFERRRVGYYVSRVKDEEGKWYRAWVELPDEPYILKYLEARKLAQ